MLLERNPAFHAAYGERILLSVPVGVYDEAAFARMDAFLARIEAVGDGGGTLFFNQALPRSPIPRGPAARRLRQLLSAELHRFAVVVQGIPGEGLRASATRVFLHALSLAYARTPSQWVRDVREAATWAAARYRERHPEDPEGTGATPERLHAWLTEAFARLGLADELADL